MTSEGEVLLGEIPAAPPNPRVDSFEDEAVVEARDEAAAWALPTRADVIAARPFLAGLDFTSTLDVSTTTKSQMYENLI